MGKRADGGGSSQGYRPEWADKQQVVLRAWTTRLLLGLMLSFYIVSLALAAPTRVLVSPKRLVKLFNFESTDAQGQKIGAIHQLPQHWYVIGRPAGTTSKAFLSQPLNERLIHKSGFPAYTTVAFSSKYHTSGQYSLHLGLNGGSAGAFLEVGTLPAVPHSDYVVTARVRTAQLKHAAAYLCAYFIDSNGRRIGASMRQTKPIRTKGKWTTVAVKLSGRFASAAWIGLQVEVLQPHSRPGSVLGDDQIVLRDVRGGAWFDDIAIWQVPHVQVSTQSTVNIIRNPAKPKLQMVVRDLTDQQMTAHVNIYDLRRRVVASQTRQVGAGHAGQWYWTPKLPGFGWYLVDLQVRESTYGNRGGPIARTLGAFLWLPKRVGASQYDPYRFGLVAQGLAPDRLALMPDLLHAVGVNRIVLSAWQRDLRKRDLERQQQALGHVLGNVMAGQRQIGLSLWPIPRDLKLAAGVKVNQPLPVLERPGVSWLSYLAPVLRWQGRDVHEWWLGRTRHASAFFDKHLPKVITELQHQLKAMVPNPTVVVPWQLSQSRLGDMPSHTCYAIDVSPGITAAQLPAYLKEWRQPPADYALVLREPPATRETQVQRVRDLALRMVQAWSAGAPTVMISKPWTGAAERKAALLPGPLLGVFANTASRLAGRHYLGRLPIGKGLRAMIFDGPNGGMLVAWNRSAPSSQAKVNIYLGKHPVEYDVFGNARPIACYGSTQPFHLTRTPIFITGINPRLALLRSSFKLKPSFIESLQRPHKCQITLTNPWRRTLTGTMRITAPAGWSIHPRMRSFTIASGQTVHLPLTLDFPIDEVAGEKRLAARFQFTTDKPYDITLSTPMKLGLKNIDFDATLAVEADPDHPSWHDAVVDCVVTNTGKKKRSLFIFADLRGHPRQERLIPRLGAGQSVVRRFLFRHAGKQIDQRRDVWTGVRQANGPAILNKKLSFGR